ncbi:hypothetical protein BDV97DRAFT_115827 [Delphinella strobiligena]|nr:hypothetical protein BDV97DRAFT_115827 [Delphinella strobiligena]
MCRSPPYIRHAILIRHTILFHHTILYSIVFFAPKLPKILPEMVEMNGVLEMYRKHIASGRCQANAQARYEWLIERWRSTPFFFFFFGLCLSVCLSVCPSS